MPIGFDPDAVFGTHVATGENDNWLNVYAAYDLNNGQPCSALDVNLMCADGTEFAFRYPLTEPEQAVLLGKMDAYCLERTGMALADFRAGIWRRNSNSTRPPAWPSCEHAVGPVSALWEEGRPESRLAGKPPRWGRFRPGLGRSIFVLG